MTKTWDEHFMEDPLIVSTMREKNMTANEAFQYLYVGNFSIEAVMPTLSIDVLIELYEIREVAGVLSPTESKQLTLLYALKEYEKSETISIPQEIKTADEFFEWLQNHKG
jgi:hypothetical protein